MASSLGKTNILASGVLVWDSAVDATAKTLPSNDLHNISVIGSGTVKIELFSADNGYIEFEAGVNNDSPTYIQKNTTKIRITETGAASPVDVAINSYS